MKACSVDPLSTLADLTITPDPLTTRYGGSATRDESTLLATIDQLVAGQQWADAVETLKEVDLSQVSPPLRLRGNLVRNIAAMRQHRPDIYKNIIALLNPGGTQPVAIENGMVTLAMHAEASPGAARSAQMAQERSRQIFDNCPPQSSIILTSVLDGHLLHQLCIDSSAPSAGGSTQSIIVIEPDLDVLINALMIHDLSIAEGPIAQQRFSWYIGDQWHEEFHRDYIKDPWLASPDLVIRHGAMSAARAATIKATLAAVASRDEDWSKDAKAYYEQLTISEISAVLQDSAQERPRRPRVLLPSARFTTVLHGSYSDAAQAFESLGFDVQLLCEPQDSMRMSRGVLQRALATFKPDLVLIIDHLRHEYDDTFPPNLPVASWTQDHLENLTNREAGHSVGKLDFILTTMKQWYANEFSYPASQCIPLPKLTRSREARTRMDSVSTRYPSHDLVYVSNASGDPDTLLQNTVNTLRNRAGVSPSVTDIAQLCGRELIDSYRNEQAHPHFWHIGRMLDHIAASAGHTWSSIDERSMVIQALNHPLNNTLFRQQALRWVARVARSHSLDFALYGMNWDKNHEFAEFAHGPISYGDDLDEMTRAARINLQIVPSYCLHQRMLDGLAAGGFFLVRPTPADHLMPRMAQFLIQHCPNDAGSVESVREALSGEPLTQFNQLLHDAECLSELTGSIDLVDSVRSCIEGDMLDDSGVAIPNFHEVAFENADDLERLVQRFLLDKVSRDTIADAQWNAVESNLTYRAGLGRVVKAMHNRICKDHQRVGCLT